jgi:hypothetical protein
VIPLADVLSGKLEDGSTADTRPCRTRLADDGLLTAVTVNNQRTISTGSSASTRRQQVSQGSPPAADTASTYAWRTASSNPPSVTQRAHVMPIRGRDIPSEDRRAERLSHGPTIAE